MKSAIIVADRSSKVVDAGMITPMLMSLFDLWHFTSLEKLSALGLSESNRSVLSKYSRGGSISSSRDSKDRAGILLDIHKNLGQLFPENPEQRYTWMKTRNKAFDGRTPIETVVEMGFPGLLFVNSYLIASLSG